MSSIALPSTASRPALARSAALVVLCGLCTAVMDLAVAFAYWSAHGVSAERILQSIAAWWLGPAALSAGSTAAAQGLVGYVLLMCGLAAGYRGLAARLPVLARRPLLCGALYGLAAYGLLFGWLVPTLTGEPAFAPAGWALVCAAAYMLLIGIPCALFAALPRRG